MHPWLLTYPPISTYGACIVAALVLAWLWARGRARKAGVDPSHVDLLMPVIVAAGLVGAWVFGWVTDAVTDEQVHGAVLVGSLLLSTAAGIGYAVVARIRLGVLGDVCAPPLALGIALGRLGCFFAGCCFGKVSSFPTALLAIRFPRGSFAFLAQVQAGQLAADAAASLPVYPVQLYESFLCAMLAAALWGWYRRNSTALSGETFLAMGLGYAAIRFGVEFLRGDNPSVMSIGGMGMTFSQCVAIFIALLAAGTWIVRRRFAVQLGLRSGESLGAGNQPLRIPATRVNAPASSRG